MADIGRLLKFDDPALHSINRSLYLPELALLRMDLLPAMAFAPPGAVVSFIQRAKLDDAHSFMMAASDFLLCTWSYLYTFLMFDIAV